MSAKEVIAQLKSFTSYVQLPRTTLRYTIERMQENERPHYLKGIF